MTDQDILIHADSTDLTHKLDKNLAPGATAYWTVNGTPRQTEAGANVWFEDDGRIHTVSTIKALEEGRVWLTDTRRVDLPCPDDAPTRGFSYVEPLHDRLDEHMNGGVDR